MSNEEVPVQEPQPAGDATNNNPVLILKRETSPTRRVSLPSSSVAGAVAEEMPPAKRIKLEESGAAPPPPVQSPSHVLGEATAVTTPTATSSQQPTAETSKSLVSPEQSSATTAESATKRAAATATTTTSAPTTTATAPATTGAPAAAAAAPPPAKALTMLHLKTKYSGELEYMLREFRKLERQLLGAKGATQMEESAGSRERREKLHSFILHLEDTIRQIDLGCKLEAEGKSTVNIGVTTKETVAAKEAAQKSPPLNHLTKEQEEEENVQKLEEHILANLLPVKVRLKKQLAAQQGATRNPAGMPATRRGMLQPSEAQTGKGTFAAAAELKRKQQAEAAMALQPPAEPVPPDQTQFGKPLGRRGSSLTQKLHGQTLGSTARVHGHGVGTAAQEDLTVAEHPNRKVVYAGVAPGSKQVVQGVAVASSVHKMVIHSPQLAGGLAANNSQTTGAATSSSSTTVAAQTHQHPGAPQNFHPGVPAAQAAPKAPPMHPTTDKTAAAASSKKKLEDPTLTEEERNLLRRKLKKKKLLRRAKRRDAERQQQQVAAAAHPGAPVVKGVGARKKGALGIKVNGKKTRGPRTVEYLCALCSEAYTSVCEYNPWWALAQHECPKCRKLQIPRIDISAPANTIEYHPALLAHIEDPNAAAAAAAPATASNAASAQVNTVQPSAPSKPHVSSPQNVSAHLKLSGSDSTFASDLSDISDGNLSDISLDSDGSDMDMLMNAAEQAEHEKFGHEYTGPTLSDADSARLLILMLHASGCPCRHKNAKQRDVCQSTKYVMLHVRDCPGTTSNLDVCPFPWCRKVKHLLYHLVSCTKPQQCAICSPPTLTKEMRGLIGLNEHRLKKQRESMIAAMKASTAARPPAPSPAPVPLAPTSAVQKSAKPPSSTARPPTVVAAKTHPATTPKHLKPLPATTTAPGTTYQRQTVVPNQATSGPVVTVISGHTKPQQSASTNVAKKPVAATAAPQPAAVTAGRPVAQSAAAKPAAAVVQTTAVPAAVTQPKPTVVKTPGQAVPDSAPSATAPVIPQQASAGPSQPNNSQSHTVVVATPPAVIQAQPGVVAAPAFPVVNQPQPVAASGAKPVVLGAQVAAAPLDKPQPSVEAQPAAAQPSTASASQTPAATEAATPVAPGVAAAAAPVNPLQTTAAPPQSHAPATTASIVPPGENPAANSTQNVSTPAPVATVPPAGTPATVAVPAAQSATVANPGVVVVKHEASVDAKATAATATTSETGQSSTPNAGVSTASQSTESVVKGNSSVPTNSEAKQCAKRGSEGSTDSAAIEPTSSTSEGSQGNITEAAGQPAEEAATTQSEGSICLPTATTGNADQAPHSENAVKQVRVA